VAVMSAAGEGLPPSNKLPRRPVAGRRTQGDDGPPADGAPRGSTAAFIGHERVSTTTSQPPTLESVGFVRPSDLLRLPRGQSRPMPPLTAVDREQFEGLVRTFRPPTFWDDPALTSALACHPGVSQSPNKLRCATSKLPTDRVRYCVVGEEELEHTLPEWHRLGTALGFQNIHIRRSAHDKRLPKRHTILLAEPRCIGKSRPVQAGQPARDRARHRSTSAGDSIHSPRTAPLRGMH